MNATEKDLLRGRQEVNKILKDALNKHKQAEKELLYAKKRGDESVSILNTARAQAKQIVDNARKVMEEADKIRAELKKEVKYRRVK